MEELEWEWEYLENKREEIRKGRKGKVGGGWE